KVNDHLRYLLLNMNLDYLDNVFVPRNGIRVTSNVEYSSLLLASDINYTRFSLSADYYFTPLRLHTLRFGGSFLKTYDSPPFYKQFIFGGPQEFAGADYMQINGTKFIIGRGEYRYEYKRDVFFKGIINTLIDPDIFNPINHATTEPRIGIGIGVMFTSILGPIELMLVRGDESYQERKGSQYLLHFSAGMKF
ncbi:MAG: BamA/TamA family outer membrane protein, partial [Bacteroidota bacterium]|nr:BamA/TamA family outer membrane protein [Bacteroidota bacterium]